MTSLFIFRRDLRLIDNTALLEALKNSKSVIPLFFLDKRQIESPYHSKSSLAFMKKALQDLNEQLKKRGSKLFLFHGVCEELLQELIISTKAKAVYHNKDYTPFSLTRDAAIKEICLSKNIEYYSFDDALLTAPGTVLKPDDKPYTVFTPFYKQARAKSILEPKANDHTNFYSQDLKNALEIFSLDEILGLWKLDPLFDGGREKALKTLENTQAFKNYKEERNFPYIDQTTHLSPHHKFGTVSIRETYYAALNAFSQDHHLISELFWRDFFTHILFHFPHALGKSFYPKYDALVWENDPKKFEAWKKGETGFPIVDAGMRQLNSLGWMHNRTRMITASFLIKDLHVDWRLGEKYFANQLIDYDPAVNNGSWQWAASTGCDAQPYFRIFNPWLQQKRFDIDCKYIKKWVPELQGESPSSIHDWKGSAKYPAPIVDHRSRVEHTKKMYGSI